MNELVISTYIQIMQDGLVDHDKQESAGRFIFDSISIQENVYISTDISAKKISRLVSRKDPVPDDFKQESLKKSVVANVEQYFRNEVVKDLNPYTKDDTLQKLMNVITQDIVIGQKKKKEFKALFDSGNEAKFLSETFLYSLQRNNKLVNDTVEYQDAPLLEEVNYKCPLTKVNLVEEIKGQPKKKYEITQIYPDDLSPKEEAAFSAVHKKPDNLDDPSNLIALSIDASEKYLMKPTVDEFKQLLDIKEVTQKRTKALSAINRIDLEEDIRLALDALVSLTASQNLPPLSYDALKIGDKINDFLLQNEVETLVLQYYRYIESVFSEVSDDFDTIASEVKLSSQKLEKAGLSQEDVIIKLADWIHGKAFGSGDKGMLACRIVVCFFIQNCEVFYK